MFSESPGDPGSKAAERAHHEADLHSGVARLVEGVDDGRVGEAVDLDGDLPERPPITLRRDEFDDSRSGRRVGSR